MSPTGTERIQVENGVYGIPGPTLPKPEPVEPKRKAAKPSEVATAPFTVVATQHLVKSLAADGNRNRLARLKTLSHSNRDVAWLLAEYGSKQAAKQSAKPSKSTKTP